MENILCITDLKVSADRDRVLSAMDCFPDSPLYEETAEEYGEVETRMRAVCAPAALAAFCRSDGRFAGSGIPAGSGVLCVLRSIGFEASALSGAYFSAGDYLKGMIADKLADQLLFSIERDLNPRLLQACRARGFGVAGRFDPPDQVPMTAQKFIYESVRAQETLGYGLSSGFMIDPQKSCTTLYLLSPDTSLDLMSHDCRRCGNLQCKNRRTYGGRVTIEGREGGELTADGHAPLLEALRAGGVYIPAVCGGAGRCGKCAFTLVRGVIEPSGADRRFFTERELREGRRLACTAYPEGDVTIRLDTPDENAFDVVAEESGAGQSAARAEYAAAADIGTTTITVVLVDRRTGEQLAADSFVNRQRAYGADVISRQTAAVEGKADELREMVRAQLLEGVKRVVAAANAEPARVKAMAIAGNTTMIHLLMGWPCKGLGVFPFAAYSLKRTDLPFSRLFENDFLDCTVSVLPGISTYVGGDIVSGIVQCGMDRSEKPVLLLDLGTNGEMALGDRTGILCTSTAAGPAFEGGNIEWGTGSIPGAICSVRIENGQARVRTIGDAPPVGICGTGVIETAAELVKAELVDETGRLDDAYFNGGFPLAETADGRAIRFTQKDVREIQLAKSAVRAGLETLLLRRGEAYADLDRVYLAGGFGYRTDKDKAAAIGMLPEALIGRTTAVGNSSLAGAVRFLTEPDAAERAGRVAAEAREIGLAADKDFSRLYMENMIFGEE